jgi:hypothetical protein
MSPTGTRSMCGGASSPARAWRRNHRRSAIMTRRNARRLTSLPTCTRRPSGKIISIISIPWRSLTGGGVPAAFGVAAAIRTGTKLTGSIAQDGPRVPDAASCAAGSEKRHTGQLLLEHRRQAPASPRRSGSFSSRPQRRHRSLPVMTSIALSAVALNTDLKYSFKVTTADASARRG